MKSLSDFFLQPGTIDGDIELAEFARQLYVETDKAWDAVVEKPDELEKAYYRGRAHALCEVLGDHLIQCEDDLRPGL